MYFKIYLFIILSRLFFLTMVETIRITKPGVINQTNLNTLNVIISLHVRSSIECLTICFNTNACNSVNIERAPTSIRRTCQLIRNEDGHLSDLTPNNEWNFMYLDICRLSSVRCLHGGTCRLSSDQSYVTCDCPSSHPNCLINCDAIVDDSCFTLVSQWVNWFAASDHCTADTGRLAEVTSAEINNQLKAIATDMDEWIWIGGLYVATEGRWEWASSGREIVFEDWGLLEPNNIPSSTSICIHIYPSVDAWADRPCVSISGLGLYFFCEYIS